VSRVVIQGAKRVDKVTLKKGRAIVSFRQEKRKVDAALDCYIICTFTRWYNKKYQRHNCMSKVGFVRNSIYGKGLKKMASCRKKNVGKLCEGETYARFDEGDENFTRLFYLTIENFLSDILLKFVFIYKILRI